MMTQNYSPGTPVDKFGIAKYNYPPAKIALASQNKENASNSSILLLTQDTTELEVCATGQNVAGKWLSQATVDSSVAGTSVLTASPTNYDFMVANNTVRRFVVPVAVFNADQGSVQGANRANGLYPAVAFKTFAGTGSVLTAQF